MRKRLGWPGAGGGLGLAAGDFVGEHQLEEVGVGHVLHQVGYLFRLDHPAIAAAFQEVAAPGYGDMDRTAMLEPRISLVAQSAAGGRMADEWLFARIKGSGQPKRWVVLVAQLIVRASTGTRAEWDGSDEP